MKTNFKILLALLLVIMLSALAFFLTQASRQNNQAEILEEKANPVAVENYIKENISTLSPEEAVLGGTFYVTDINFIDEHSALISYEDGHIALQAIARFHSKNKQLVIDAFDLIEGKE